MNENISVIAPLDLISSSRSPRPAVVYRRRRRPVARLALRAAALLAPSRGLPALPSCPSSSCRALNVSVATFTVAAFRVAHFDPQRQLALLRQRLARRRAQTQRQRRLPSAAERHARRTATARSYRPRSPTPSPRACLQPSRSHSAPGRPTSPPSHAAPPRSPPTEKLGAATFCGVRLPCTRQRRARRDREEHARPTRTAALPTARRRPAGAGSGEPATNTRVVDIRR